MMQVGAGMFDYEHFKVKDQNLKLAGRALEGRNIELRNIAQAIPLEELIRRTGTSIEKTSNLGDGFKLELFGRPLSVKFPALVAYDGNGTELPVFIQSLLLHYFVTANGAALAGRWVTFADLPDGRMYAQAFQGYSGDQVAKSFGLNLPEFHSACKKARGKPCGIADSSYSFLGLPRIPLLVSYWLGDDEFPSTCKVLFDSSACNYLPIDGCAIIGSMLVRNILNPK